jgi:hypothetical protein
MLLACKNRGSESAPVPGQLLSLSLRQLHPDFAIRSRWQWIDWRAQIRSSYYIHRICFWISQSFLKCSYLPFITSFYFLTLDRYLSFLFNFYLPYIFLSLLSLIRFFFKFLLLFLIFSFGSVLLYFLLIFLYSFFICFLSSPILYFFSAYLLFLILIFISLYFSISFFIPFCYILSLILNFIRTSHYSPLCQDRAIDSLH